MSAQDKYEEYRKNVYRHYLMQKYTLEELAQRFSLVWYRDDKHTPIKITTEVLEEYPKFKGYDWVFEVKETSVATFKKGKRKVSVNKIEPILVDPVTTEYIINSLVRGLCEKSGILGASKERTFKQRCKKYDIDIPYIPLYGALASKLIDEYLSTHKIVCTKIL